MCVFFSFLLVLLNFYLNNLELILLNFKKKIIITNQDGNVDLFYELKIKNWQLGIKRKKIASIRLKNMLDNFECNLCLTK